MKTSGPKSSNENVGDSIIAENASWNFRGPIAEHFTEHVRRSVPLYDEGHDLVCRISDFFLKDDSVCYELGVSTGALIGKLARRQAKKAVRFIGLDIESQMIAQARKEIGNLRNVELEIADINTFPFEPADFIVAYYTIQFVPPRIRQDLLNKIYQSLNWGGCFLMFDKVRANDARFQDMTTLLYTEFKLEQGYTPQEIVAKSRSLKGVLEPFSTQGNLDLLKRAGFVDILSIMKYVSFEGFLAIK